LGCEVLALGLKSIWSYFCKVLTFDTLYVKTSMTEKSKKFEVIPNDSTRSLIDDLMLEMLKD